MGKNGKKSWQDSWGFFDSAAQLEALMASLHPGGAREVRFNPILIRFNSTLIRHQFYLIRQVDDDLDDSRLTDG